MVNNNRRLLNDGWRLLNDGRRLLRDGRRLLNDGRRLLNDGRRLLNDGWRLLNDGWRLLWIISRGLFIQWRWVMIFCRWVGMIWRLVRVGRGCQSILQNVIAAERTPFGARAFRRSRRREEAGILSSHWRAVSTIGPPPHVGGYTSAATGVGGCSFTKKCSNGLAGVGCGEAACWFGFAKWGGAG